MEETQSSYQYGEGKFIINDPELRITFFEEIHEIPQLTSITPSATGMVTLQRDGVVFQKSAYKEGKLHGPSFTYFPNSTVASERWFVRGLPHGRSCYYSPQAVLLSKVGYCQGKLQGSVCAYYPSGKLLYSGTFFHGLPHGKCTTFQDDGCVLRSTEFLEGRRHGIDVGWTEDGFLLFCEQWEQGKKTKTILSDFFANSLKIRGA